MKKIWISLTLLAILVAGCRKPETIGFLSDYSRLEKVSDSTLVYSASDNPLTGYKNIIVDPVQYGVVGGRLKQNDLSDMMEYLELSARKAVLSHYNLADKPAKDTAILRVSLTSVDSDSPIMVNPQAQTLSGATVEIEIIDSLTNDILYSLVESRVDEPVALSRMSKWATAKDTIDQWAQTLEVILLLQQPQEENVAALQPAEPESLTEIQVAKPLQPAQSPVIAQNLQ